MYSTVASQAFVGIEPSPMHAKLACPGPGPGPSSIAQHDLVTFLLKRSSPKHVQLVELLSTTEFFLSIIAHLLCFLFFEL